MGQAGAGIKELVMISVMGATGHVGGEIARRLVKSGQKVRALGRSREKLGAVEGAEAVAGDASDAAYLTNAFRGADAVFTLLPPDLHSADYRALQDGQGEAIVKAVRDAGVRYVVLLSSVGADQPSGTGPIAGLHAQEERLRVLRDTNVLALRPGYFFENFYGSLPVIKHQGVLGDAVGPEVALPMIATRDIAAAASEALLARDWRGFVVRELLGPRDLTHAEAARIIGGKIGRPDLPYVQLPYEDMTGALVGAGLSPSVSSLYVEMSRAFNEGLVRSVEGRNASNTTPTRFEDFATELARAYQAM
ncbi:MAG TPA: NAD(P)H-binding protein [Vicinamibacteria bacterium]|nr:NAD(P)H-binding protein [Vicinamibacteria bacterium]